MVKKSKITKEQRGQELANEHCGLREELRVKGDYETLRKLPRDPSPTKSARRCKITGRPRGVLRKFEMSRIVSRGHAHKDQIPDVKKSSW